MLFCRNRYAHDGFLSGSSSGFGSAAGAFTTFDENSPVCGGFGLSSSLMISPPFLPSAQASAPRRPPLRTYAPRLPAVARPVDRLRVVSSCPLAWMMSFRLTRAMIFPSPSAVPKYAGPGIRLCLDRGTKCLLTARASIQRTGTRRPMYSACVGSIASGISNRRAEGWRPSGIRVTAPESMVLLTRTLPALSALPNPRVLSRGRSAK